MELIILIGKILVVIAGIAIFSIGVGKLLGFNNLESDENE